MKKIGSVSRMEALRKILRQERDSGFQDITVIGGLDRFLLRWDHELKQCLGEFHSYSVLTPPQRELWANAALDRLASSGQIPPSGKSSKHSLPHSTVSRKRKANAPDIVSLDDDVVCQKGVSRQNLTRLKRLGVEKVRDLIYLFPHRHNDFANIINVSQLEPGREQTVIVTVWESTVSGSSPRRKSTQTILGDDTGNVRAIWFNNRYMARVMRPGTKVVISGRVNVFRGRPVFESPEYELLQDQDELVHTGRLVPVYSSTAGLPQRTLRKLVKQALDNAITRVDEILPDELRHRTGLIGIQDAIGQLHYPDSHLDWKAARRRLAFDELFLMQLAIIDRKRRWQQEGQGIPLKINASALSAFIDSLPFSLTSAQIKVMNEILNDLESDRAVSRLLQGDVGSGKTVVAVVALLVAAINGYQGALLVPTELLAEQHFFTISRLLSGLSQNPNDEHLVSLHLDSLSSPITVGLLLGSFSKRAKEDMHRRIADGGVDIIVGTQSLIQPTVEMPRLAVVVVDEQHRLGVMQRATLRGKGQRPHLLAMSATPIPRSLALTLYGDLDVSVIDEMPPDRQQVRTRWVESKKRQVAYNFVRKEVESGRQAFIVCPLIEESEFLVTRAATEEYQRLSTKVFPDLKLGLIHGKMTLREKEQIMEAFGAAQLDILVSTPVIEVGIDVPNATVMLIDGADRFGLAQLHQFRGRVGRGSHPGYCMLLADAPGEEAHERLRTIERVHDGFQLAEEDLRLRGPGDYLGTRQSGLPDLRVARITDYDILSLARCEAEKVLDSDPDLTEAENKLLAGQLERYSYGLSNEMS